MLRSIFDFLKDFNDEGARIADNVQEVKENNNNNFDEYYNVN
ncbi:MAG: hypothetical protein ACQEP9_03120 [Bacillota bacterium]